MDAPKCKICQERHYGMCPPLKATGSTGAKARASSNQRGSRGSSTVELGTQAVMARGPNDAGSTPVLPVDTSPGVAQSGEHAVAQVVASRPTAGVTSKPKRGRPPTGFDKKAHDAKKARERRAAQKAQGKETT